MQARHLRPTLTAAVVMALLALSGAARAAVRGEPGVLQGRVTDAESGQGLSFANVMIQGTSLGAMTGEDGTYAIRNVPAGRYAVAVSYVGYASRTEKDVRVEPGQPTDLNFQLIVQPENLPEIVAYGDRPLVEVRNTSSVKHLIASDIANLAVDPTIEDVIGQQAGVTVHDGEIHIRGGRSDETLLLVDGVSLKDATGGDAIGKALSAGSAAEVTVAKGGFDARYGDAISGVVDVRVKEGSERFRGKISYMTDSVVGDENLHYANIQIEGPNPLLNGLGRIGGLDRAQTATFHLDLSAELSDTYLPSIKDLGKGAPLVTDYRGAILGKTFTYGSFFRPRADNNWRATLKSAWAPHPAHKLSLTYIKSLGFGGVFSDRDIGDVNRNITSYPWAWSRRLDHHYSVVDDFYSLSLQWNHTLSGRIYQQIRLKNTFNTVHRDVAGKMWTEYEVPYDNALEGAGLGHPYFVDTGDASDYRDRYTELWGVDWELTAKSEHHDLALGLSGSHEDVQYFTLDAYTVGEGRPLGEDYDLFHVFPSKGQIFVQDQIEYPGINLKVGLRGDVFLPGEQVERLYEEASRPGFSAETRAEWDESTHELLGRRYKVRWSPRVAVSHPISERSHFFFNYGRFTQWPTYFYLYAKTGAISSAEFPRIGNPNLEPEVSAQYEFGAGHRFSDRFSLRSTVFFKDIYDYPTSITVDIGSRATRRERFYIYRNLDYARSRGFEIELEKRRERFVSYALSYSYSVATGKSSDPNALPLVQALGGDAREAELDEQFMWWNRPHKLTLSAGYTVGEKDRPPRLLGGALPRDWKLSLFWMIQSGEAYSPQSPFGAQIGKDYSRNGPIDSVLDLDFSKGFSVSGRRFTFSVAGRNLFNHRTVLEIDPATGQSPRAGVGGYWRDSESPRTLFANADAVRETDADASSFASENASVIRTMTQLANPAFLSAPRTLRMGISYEF